MQSIIYVYHRDIGVIGPRSDCGYRSIHREVKEIVEIEGGLSGKIRYDGKDVTVYRRADQIGVEIWETNASCLRPVKVTRVYGGKQ